LEVLDEGVHDAPELRRIRAAQPVAGAARLDLDIELHGHPLVAAAAGPRAAGAILVRRGADRNDDDSGWSRRSRGPRARAGRPARGQAEGDAAQCGPIISTTI